MEKSYYLVGEIATLVLPQTPKPDLSSGWQWTPTDWLYYWLVSNDPTDPVNNRCLLRFQGINSHTKWMPLMWDCLHCPAAPQNRGDVIRQYVDRFKEGLNDIEPIVDNYDTSPLKERIKTENDWDDEGLDKYSWPEFKSLLHDLAPQEAVSIEAARNVFFGKDDHVIGVSSLPFPRKGYVITAGRHRICAAWRFDVPELPVLVNL